jgi:predicted O-methyltransferase YrrM
MLERLDASSLEASLAIKMREEKVRPFQAGAMGRDACRALYLIVRGLRPSRVLETGVSAGVSSAHILQGLADNGTPHSALWSIDLAPEEAPRRFVFARSAADPVELTRAWERYGSGWAIPPDLRSRWRLHLGDTFQLLPALLASSYSIDMFLHDSDHRFDYQMFEYRTVWPILRPGGLLLSHDVDASRAFEQFAAEAGRAPIYLDRKTAALVKP